MPRSLEEQKKKVLYIVSSFYPTTHSDGQALDGGVFDWESLESLQIMKSHLLGGKKNPRLPFRGMTQEHEETEEQLMSSNMVEYVNRAY